MSDEIAEGPPPVVPCPIDSNAAPDIRASEPSAMEVFFAWERLRIFFNAFHAVGLLYVISGLRGDFHNNFVIHLVIIVLLVNATFSAGPAVEGYFCWFGMPRLPARIIAGFSVNLGAGAIIAIWLWR